MAVTAPGPRDASPGVLREDEWETMSLRVALREHAREVREAARATVAHSRGLKVELQVWRSETLARRCAWCSRYHVGDRWVALRATPHPNRTTHTVCDDCVEALREADQDV